MAFVRRNLARGFDALAVFVVAFALFHFFIQPRFMPAAATPAPALNLATLGGGPFTLAAHRGRLVFLDFWASWCGPCKLSLPLVEHYARTHANVDVLAIDVGENGATSAEFARSERLTSVVLDPDQIAAHAYGVEVFPTIVVIDPAGVIRAKWIGFNPAIEMAMADASARYGRPAR